MNALQAKVARAVREKVRISPYDPSWPARFRREARHLRACLPVRLLGRIEHFGSTAVPGLAAKPLIDLLVEATSLRAARTAIAPILGAQGYEYFWRPTFGDDVPPWYAFFIRRDRAGARTHHLHVMTRRPAFRGHWERLRFRDHLRAQPKVAAEYARLKRRLARAHANDRVAYSAGKSRFIRRVMAENREAVICRPRRAPAGGRASRRGWCGGKRGCGRGPSPGTSRARGRSPA